MRGDAEALMPEPVIPVFSRGWIDSDCTSCGGVSSRRVFGDRSIACLLCVDKECQRLTQGVTRTFLLAHCILCLFPENLTSFLDGLYKPRVGVFPSEYSSVLDRLLYVVVLKLVRERGEVPLLRGDVTTFFQQSGRTEQGVEDQKTFLEDLLSFM
jgi:hypothetical protein